MNNQDNFFDQFKQAAQQTEQQQFPGFEEVWQQVENRLDQQEKKVIPIWRRTGSMAAAAVGFIFLLAGVFWWNQPSEVPPTPAVATVQKPLGPQPPATIEDSSVPVSTQQITPPDDVAIAPNPNVPLAETVVADTARMLVSADNVSPLSPTNLEADKRPPAIAEAPLVKGRITDAQGQPLPGSVVMVKGTQRGVITDSAGYFAINANNGELLNVSLIGYDSKDIVATQGANTPIALQPALMAALSEVVVTGYSSKNRGKKDAAKSQGNKSLEMSDLGLTSSLQGRVAGVQVSPYLQGAPGAGSEIRLRGINSVSGGSEPLYVLNGLPISKKEFARIKPTDIQQIDVLKEAQAAAIYGSRANNGVVIVSTKGKAKSDSIAQQNLNKQLQQLGIVLGSATEPGRGTDWSSEDYNPLVENPFTSPAVSPLSTFSIDVDNAAYTNIRRYINNGQKVPADIVRIEEMINFFKYRYAPPTGNQPFAVHTEYFEAPWNERHQLLRVALQAKDIPAASLPPSNIVFLLDVSGSMESENKLPLLKSSMKVLVNELRAEDKVSIVVYAGAAGLVLPPTSGAEKETIMQALYKLNAGGSTAGGQGIELAYKTAAENFIENGNNRVVLATDGDFNVGVSSQAGLQRLIEEKRETGIFLTCLGFGMGNYKDNRLEVLADKGNGNYAYIDNQQEANRFLGKEFKGSMFAVAKDVKLQIEFNPAVVGSYRLIGYENRKLNDEDFVNDKVDAGEMGANHTVTALYEIIPVGVKSSFAAPVPTLKYNKPAAPATAATELATIKTRYKTPTGTSSIEGSVVVKNESVSIGRASADSRFATAVAWFGLHLRNSSLIAIRQKELFLQLARAAIAYDPDGYKAEFIRLVEAGW